MKKARLDQILLRRGVVTEEQIRKALLRQKSHGGKLGTHLLFYRFFSEEQLVQALAEQFQVHGVRLGDSRLPDDVVRKIPADVAEAFCAIPFRFDPDTGELAVAISDPDSPDALNVIRRASGIRKIVFYVAPESVLRNKIAFHYHGLRNPGVRQVIELPELFGGETNPGDSSRAGDDRPGGSPPAEILMFTGQEFLKNVLPSVFEREGMRLTFAASAAEVSGNLKGKRFDRVLLTEDVAAEWKRHVEAHRGSGPRPEIVVFRTIGSALLENPVPYERMSAALLASVQCLADVRSKDLAVPIPYALIGNEIGRLGRAVGLPRLAVDGLRVAAHLIAPAPGIPIPDAGPVLPCLRVSPGDLESAVAIAKRLDFPWDIAGCLRALSFPPPGDEAYAALPQEKKEIAAGAGALAIVWFRHLPHPNRSGGDGIDSLKSRLRAQADRLAPSFIIEAYVRILEEDGAAEPGARDILVAGGSDPLLAGLMTDLRLNGFRTVEAGTIDEAEAAFLRRRPSAVLVAVDRSTADADRFCRRIREEWGDVATALFAVTHRNEPSYLLNLMDSWFTDVLTLPTDSRVAVARITKSLVERGKGGAAPGGRGFRATFRDLSFTDLVQTLSTGAKNVHMRIEMQHGERAELFLRNGRIAHAVCGGVEGAEAVYRVIRSQEGGAFYIEPADAFPPDNVALPTDYLLLEGARRLDEARAKR